MEGGNFSEEMQHAAVAPKLHIPAAVQTDPKEASQQRRNFKQPSRKITAPPPRRKNRPLGVKKPTVEVEPGKIEPEFEMQGPAPEPQVQDRGKPSNIAEGSIPKQARTTPESANIIDVEKNALRGLLRNLFSHITDAVSTASTPQSLMDLPSQFTYLLGAAEALGADLACLKVYLEGLAAQGKKWQDFEAAAEPCVIEQIQALEELASLRNQAAVALESSFEKRLVALQVANELDKLRSNRARLMQKHSALLMQCQQVEHDINVKRKQYAEADAEARKCEQEVGNMFCRSEELEARIGQQNNAKAVDPEARAMADQAGEEATKKKNEVLGAIKQMYQKVQILS